MFTSSERTAVFSISLIFAFRMFGLFVMIPIFSPYLQSLNNSTPFLIGLTMGIYGLTQALLQIPFGILSDFIGRREVITLGLLIFLAGCIIAGSSNSIWMVMLGRALQGAGAISGTLIALLSDVTSEASRTKAMAMVGVSIGCSFMFAFMLGPILNSFLSINNIFYFIALIVLPILLILWNIKVELNNDNNINLNNFKNIYKISENKKLFNQIIILGFSIFTLHGILTLNFIVIPIYLKNMIHNNYQQGLFYLEIFIIAIIFMVPLIIYSEKFKKQKLVMYIAVVLLVFSELMFWLLNNNFWSIMLGLVVFFIGFNVLEASLPSLVSKIAPPEIKGAIMGVYSTAQFLGPMVGGLLAGILFKYFGLVSVFILGLLWSILWLYILKFINIYNINKDINNQVYTNLNSNSNVGLNNLDIGNVKG